MTPPGETSAAEIAARFRGMIAVGVLGAGERLPTVRQTASELGVAPGTAARAFRQLELEGVIVTRVGSGTRVAPGASPLPASTVIALRALVEDAQTHGLTLDGVSSALAAIWRSDADPEASA